MLLQVSQLFADSKKFSNSVSTIFPLAVTLAPSKSGFDKQLTDFALYRFTSVAN